MRFLFSLLLVFAVTCVFFHDAVFADGSLSDTGHKSLDALEADYNNSEKEQERFQGNINDYVKDRDRYISLANDLKVMGSNSVGSMQTIMISSLSAAVQKSLANTVALTTRAFLTMFGSSSLASAADSAVSTARGYHDSAASAYNNTNRTDADDEYEEGYDRFDSANSAIEAWYENGLATDHYNAHVSPSEWLIATSAPHGPSYITWPDFECPGPCTNAYNTVSEASDVHHEKCGEAASLSALLDFRSKQTILAARSVKEGCGVEWYSCDSNHLSNEAYHLERTCAKGVWATRYTDYTNGKERYRLRTCGKPFRHCMPHTAHHKSSTFKDAHSETDDTVSSPPIASTPPPPPQPTDNTPNCQDCTSDCSSPCNCTNSGTCGGTVSTPPSGSTPPSPSYHACNVHETSVSGDHSYISSCSSSNANGTCQNSSGYYACSPHSHSYPSPPPPPEPPSPTLCPANDWTGCGSTTSHGKTCGAGHLYYTCNPSAVSWHATDRTCSRTGCNATYTDCSRGSDTKHCLGKYYYHQK